jgi:hypothetical protein
MKLDLAAVAAVMLIVSQPAQAQRSCVVREDAAAAFLALAPTAIEAVAERCGAHLPAGAFLNTSAGAMAKRYRAEVGRPTESVAAFMKAVSGKDLPSGTSAEAVLTLASELLKPEVAKLKAGDCPEVNAAIEALAPLPSSNVGMLLGAIISLALNNEKDEKPPFRICDE